MCLIILLSGEHAVIYQLNIARTQIYPRCYTGQIIDINPSIEGCKKLYVGEFIGINMSSVT